MPPLHGHTAAASLVLAGAIAGMPATHEVAAPEIIIFGGGSLEVRITITDWHANQRFVAALAESGRMTDGVPDARSGVHVGLYWGLEWRAVANDPRRLSALTPHEAPQQALLYLSSSKDRSVLLLFTKGAPDHRFVRHVAADGLAVLIEQGVVPSGSI